MYYNSTKIPKISLVIWGIILFLLTSYSSFFSPLFEVAFSNYFRYLIAIILIVVCLYNVSTYNHNKYENVSFRNIIGKTGLALIIYALMYIISYVFSVNGSFSFVYLLIQVIAAILCGMFAHTQKDIKIGYILLVVMCSIILVDTFRTLYCLMFVNNMAVRYMTTAYAGYYSQKLGVYGISNLNHISAYLSAIPLMIGVYGEANKKIIKIMVLLSVITMSLTILFSGSTMTTGLLLLEFGIILVNKLIENKSIRILIVGMLIIVLFLIPWDSILEDLSIHVDNPAVSERLMDISVYLKSGDQGVAMSSRLKSYSHGLNGFLKSPIWGKSFSDSSMELSGHSSIIDWLARWGLLGLGVYIALLKEIKANMEFATSKKKMKYINLSFYFFILTQVINTTGYYVQGYCCTILLGAIVSRVSMENNNKNQF